MVESGSFLPVSNEEPRPALLAQLPRIRRSDGGDIRILLVDDEEVLTRLVGLALGYEGWRVEAAGTGAEALAALRAERPDAVVLDIMLPDTDGIALLRRMRELAPGIPVLFLTARDSVGDRVLGLTAGGDDYLTKPFSLAELVARLRGLLRRSIPGQEEIRIEVGPLMLDERTHEVTLDGRAVSLTATEFELLRYLMRNPDLVLSRSQILDNVWHYDFAGRRSIVDLYISYLRKKLARPGPTLIQTVRGVGYILRAPQP
ncbi:response regulator transcription factor [Microbacterium resistens]|uniref:Response regulator transcription factor n=1 Tax=Microbacterium resistens TaxID=156977 RepID=A0ABY3RN54_9MICO|nr:response regulator transcription factor [Microbacterium resistens]UGS24987.1 response regulator transcription factor [Microbacterium resistens]